MSFVTAGLVKSPLSQIPFIFCSFCANSRPPHLAINVQLPRANRQVRLVLRISVEDNTTAATLKVEGRLVGPWTRELSETWDIMKPTLGRKILRLDLCGLMFVDEVGKGILREICRETGAEVLSNSPLTCHFAEEVKKYHGSME